MGGNARFAEFVVVTVDAHASWMAARQPRNVRVVPISAEALAGRLFAAWHNATDDPIVHQRTGKALSVASTAASTVIV